MAYRDRERPITFFFSPLSEEGRKEGRGSIFSMSVSQRSAGLTKGRVLRSSHKAVRCGGVCLC